MLETRLIIALAFFATAAIVGAADDFRTTTQHSLRQRGQRKEIWIGDILSSDDMLSYKGYVLRKRHKKIRYDYPRQAKTASSWIDVSYAVLKHKGIVLAKFDANIYFGMGNNTRFGLVSLLGGRAKQAVISQDVPRTGTQWVVALSPYPRVIFDGPRWAVGREGDDLGVIDLDGDGVYEIAVPLADFYDLQDKMSISQIPLPEIIFKYDSLRRQYLPANSLFHAYALEGMTTSTNIGTEDQLQHRSIVLRTTLTLIYAGKRKDGWRYFNQSYKLEDKEDIRRRVESILVRQPVYKFIYNRGKHK